MGWLFLKANKRTEQLLEQSHSYMTMFGDDQKAFNYALNDFLLKQQAEWFAVKMGSGSKDDHPTGGGKALLSLTTGDVDREQQIVPRVLILPFSVIPRYCSDDMQNRALPTNQTDLPIYQWLYTDAPIIHCHLTKKTAAGKVGMLRELGLWIA
jgi:hypothetical protein